ncbi:uncharacterized protein [Hetaerina americana]|uniref:uncharacterized protein n=1 Tax=Hetaerina americana TaxID=62018 RepID=UPI003A7F4499
MAEGAGGTTGGRVEGKAAKGGGSEGGRGGSRARGGAAKASTKDLAYPDENGGRVRQGNRQQPSPSPYQRWLQGQLLGQQMKPLGSEHQIHLPAQYPRPQPPPDYQQLKGRQFRPRLQKLDAYFGRLGVLSEDCRQRLLCEVAREPARFFPLSNVLEEEAGFTGNYQYLTSQLINTTEGARLLSYMEANFRGQDRARTCDVFQLRCHSSTEEMVNFQSLVVWREMIRWLTIHVLTRLP